MQKGKDFMAEPETHLVHTEDGALAESTRSNLETGSVGKRADSSAVEHRFHTAGVGGSKPSPRTTDLIALMLADDAWRMGVEGRFWPKVMRALDWDSCWVWTGAKKRRDLNRYGSFKIKSYHTVRAHRLAYALYRNVSPGEMLVCHTCDNPECVNPEHLFLGTQKDNSDDKIAKGRFRSPDSKGEKNGAAKLSAVQVDEVRDLIRAGMTNVAIAPRFGVTHQLISRIRRGKAWGEPPMQKPYASLRRTG